MIYPHAGTATLVRRAARDPRTGDPGAGEPARTDIAGCVWWPRATADATEQGQEGDTERLSLVVPADTDIQFTDLVELDGTTYRVDGEQQRWLNPYSGARPGNEVALVRGQG